MKKEAVFLYAESSRSDVWEHEEKPSYDARILDTQYEARLFSDKGRELLNASNEDAASALLARGR
jgi:hypothetical protein